MPRCKGGRRERTSVISASRDNLLVSPMIFDGCCNSAVVEVYFKCFLLPCIPNGSVIALDNAAFNKSATLLALVQEAGSHLLFLPVYSPDLNPIEHIWAKLKRLVCDTILEVEDKSAMIENACLELCQLRLPISG